MFHDLPCRLKRVEQRHGNVNDGHIGLELFGLAKRFSAVASLATNLPVRPLFEDLAQSPVRTTV
jgi:hypothetical protein